MKMSCFKAIKNCLNSLLELIFPPRCQLCKKASPDPWCKECFSEVKVLPGNFHNCSFGVLDFIYAVFEYDGIVGKAIKKIKFSKKKKLLEVLNELLINSICSVKLTAFKFDYLVPVPLSIKKQKERGFNQAELFAYSLEHVLHTVVLKNCLVRTKDTKPQFGLKKKERALNIKNAFAVEYPELVFGKRILLIDDIYTTGATLAECARVLREAGAVLVAALAISKTV